MTADVEILAPPSDGVSSMRFSTHGSLLVASWDATLRVYDGARLRSRLELEQPLLACCFGGGEAEAFTGGLGCALQQVDLPTNRAVTVGRHDAAVRSVHYSKEYGLAVSGGWDGAVKVWDIRNGGNAKIHEAKVDGKVFAMDLRRHLLVVASSTRQVGVYDLRNFSNPLETRESPLKYQTRCVSVLPSLDGFAMGSIEGRVALEYLDDASAEKKRSYAFKCHRGKVDDEAVIYPVNTIAFHPTLGTFATGGCDGVVNFWDGANKKRITQLSKFPTSISALEFNHDGSVLAVAASYTYEEGEKDHPNDAIYLHTVQPSEVQPKRKA